MLHNNLNEYLPEIYNTANHENNNFYKYRQNELALKSEKLTEKSQKNVERVNYLVDQANKNKFSNLNNSFQTKNKTKEVSNNGVKCNNYVKTIFINKTKRIKSK